MSAKQNRKPWIIVGELIFFALFICVTCTGLFYAWVNFSPRQVPQSPVALSSAIPISLQNLEKLEPLYQFTVTDTVQTMAWSPGSRLLAIGAEWTPAIPLGNVINRGSLHLWNVVDGNGRVLYSSIPLYVGNNLSVAFSSDRQTLFFQTGSSVKLWDVQQDRELRTLANPRFFGAKTVALAQATGRELPTLPQISNAVSYALSPDSRIVAVNILDPDGYHLKLFDVATGNELRPIAGSPEVDFSNNGKVIVSRDLTKQAGYEAPILLSDVESGQVFRRLEGNVSYASRIAFSPDDTLLASQGYVWDVSSGKRFTLNTRSSPLFSVAFSPDGRFLATGARDGTVQLWGIKP